MSYGFFHCLDSFLFIYTFLPLRVSLALVTGLLRTPLIYMGYAQAYHGRNLFPAEIIDILKVFIILVCCYAMSYVDTSMLYHMIKSQSVIKLYLMYNMIEVADRLFRCFPVAFKLLIVAFLADLLKINCLVPSARIPLMHSSGQPQVRAFFCLL